MATHASLLLNVIVMSPHNHPVAVYHTTISILLHMVLYLAVIALFAYAVIQTDSLFAKILLCILLLSLIPAAIIPLLKHTKDRIIISPQYLSLTNVDTFSKQGRLTTVKKVQLPWGDIRDISSNFSIHTGKSIHIQKQVVLTHRNGMRYIIDPDLYDVVFLERKLKSFWHRFDNRH